MADDVFIGSMENGLFNMDITIPETRPLDNIMGLDA